MKYFFTIVLFANILGAFYGFFLFYPEQLGQEFTKNPFLLPFVPDCPLYSALFALVMVLVAFKTRSELAEVLYFITMAGMMKYGIWTVSVLIFYGSYYMAPLVAPLSIMLLVAHIGMFLQSFTLIGKIKPSRHLIPVALAWFLLNDFSDYFLGTHPSLPDTNLLGVTVFTVALTLVSVLISSRLLNSKISFFRRLVFE